MRLEIAIHCGSMNRKPGNGRPGKRRGGVRTGCSGWGRAIDRDDAWASAVQRYRTTGSDRAAAFRGEAAKEGAGTLVDGEKPTEEQKEEFYRRYEEAKAGFEADVDAAKEYIASMNEEARQQYRETASAIEARLERMDGAYEKRKEETGGSWAVVKAKLVEHIREIRIQ